MRLRSHWLARRQIDNRAPDRPPTRPTPLSPRGDDRQREHKIFVLGSASAPVTKSAQGLLFEEIYYGFEGIGQVLDGLRLKPRGAAHRPKSWRPGRNGSASLSSVRIGTGPQVVQANEAVGPEFPDELARYVPNEEHSLLRKCNSLVSAANRIFRRLAAFHFSIDSHLGTANRKELHARSCLPNNALPVETEAVSPNERL